MPEQTSIDPGAFREVLGHFPTGVVVVTAIEDTGRPVGMVIGSFTSVSLDPPLVAFLPTKTSKTYARLRRSSSFCVNVLAANQEQLCRHLGGSAEDKFAGLTWHPAPSGSPVLDGVVAWIDCDVDQVVDGGDHDVVFGRVRELAVESPVLPMLFFQGGYGRFTPQSLVSPTLPGLLEAARLADELSLGIDQVARELGAECSLTVPDGGDAVFIAGANYSATGGWTRLGTRYPLLAPLGPLFVEPEGPIAENVWLRRLSRGPAAVELARRQLATVHDRGWSIVLASESGPNALEAAVEAYSSPDRTPRQERQLADTVAAMLEFHEPLRLEGKFQVMQLSVPIRDRNGRVVAALRLSELPPVATAADVEQWVARLRQVATTA